LINRNFIEKNEGRLTVLQFIGFLVLIFGITGLVFIGIFAGARAPQLVSITFFATMLGFALAFPSLLEGTEGMSTMRIIVFMVTNVICMLLLKIGWASGIVSLKDIGLDQYWMGVIAFVFGAKAMQSFFESKMAVPFQKNENNQRTPSQLTVSQQAKLAVLQYEQFLKVKFPNIASVSDSIRKNDIKEAQPLLLLYVRDSDIADMPSQVTLRTPDGVETPIPVEIIAEVGGGEIHLGQQDRITAPSPGSICCLVTKDGKTLIATAGHVYSRGKSTDYGGELDISEQLPFEINGVATGKWIFQLINYKNDIAIGVIDDFKTDEACLCFKEKGHYSVTDNDVLTATKVKLVSGASSQKVREGYILDYNTAWDVPYKDKKSSKNKIILIGSTPDRVTSRRVSEPGDSGGLVYEPASGNLIGMILGGNEKFTWVLPMKEVLEKFNYQLA
jgi:hypothetical protein